MATAATNSARRRRAADLDGERAIVCLVGEQPVPNLLPIWHLRLRQIILIESPTTKRVGDNIEALLKPQHEVLRRKIDPYDVVSAENALRTLLNDPSQPRRAATFNVTGGTKPMSLAAFEVAREMRAPVIYLQSEGSESVLHYYIFEDGNVALQKTENIDELLSIDDYLRAHGLTGSKRREATDSFHRHVFEPLRPHVSEIVSGVAVDTLEIDLVIRCVNQVGVAEVKSGKAATLKNGIDQLSTASQREYLGTYTKRFLIVDRPPEANNQRLAEAHNIEVICLQDEHGTGLSKDETKKLVQTVTQALGLTPAHG